MRAMRPGTIVRLPDGREGTVVYSGLDGEGIKWGHHTITDAIMAGSGNMVTEVAPEDFALFPDAMLRDPYPNANLECVGETWEVIGPEDDDDEW